VGTGRRWCLGHRRSQAVVLASYLALVLFCVIATSAFLAMEIYAGFRPQPAQEFLARLRHWIDTHTDQVIVIVSLVLGFWLVGNSIYYIVT
jgi:hypothetical protein